jgi:hypothetical protein
MNDEEESHTQPARAHGTRSVKGISNAGPISSVYLQETCIHKPGTVVRPSRPRRLRRYLPADRHHVNESDIFQHLLPGCTPQTSGDFTRSKDRSFE